METNFVTNVHEVVYASFLSRDCPTNEVRILTKFYKVSFIVFKACLLYTSDAADE